MRARFGIEQRLNYYAPEDLELIVHRTADVLKVEIEPAGAREIARRSRGTPRVANRLLRRVRDYAQVRANGVITEDVARAALAMLDVDQFGLDDMDARILRAIIEKFDGGPVGVATISAAIGEDASTLEEVYEPFLVQQGFLQRTPARARGDADGVPALRLHAAAGAQRAGRAVLESTGQSQRGQSQVDSDPFGSVGRLEHAVHVEPA